MTSSASASPIVLLASPGAAIAPAAAATKAPKSAPDGGFQLLIDTAAQQQMAAQLADGAAPAPVAPATDSGETPTDVGNVLPLAGLMLPVDGDQPPSVDGEAKTKKTDASKDETEADATAAAAATIPLPWVPINIQAPVQPAATANTATKQSGVVDPGIAALAPAAAGVQTTTAPATNSAATTPADDDAAEIAPVSIPKTGNGVQLGTAQAAPEPGHRAAADTAAQPAPELLTSAPASGDAKTGAPDVAAGKANDVTSFADLLKPVAQSQTANDAAPAVQVNAFDGSRAHQATRPYVDASGSAATATVNVPVGSSGWSDAVVDKVMWFSANQLNSAEIKLNPPDLGPLQVRISTQHDQTSVVFSSPHAAVRDALDQALPRLRDMFGGQGLQLTDASVGGQAQRQQQQQQGNGGAQQGGSNFWFGSEDNGDAPVAVTRVVGPRLSTSAVDAYA